MNKPKWLHLVGHRLQLYQRCTDIRTSDKKIFSTASHTICGENSTVGERIQNFGKYF